MKKPTGVLCPVDMGDCSPFGEYVNAFRVMSDSDGELLLDFCIYSARENKAQVIARIRVATTFLTDIHERIGRGITEIRSVGATKNASNPMPPIFLFRRPVDEDEGDN